MARVFLKDHGVDGKLLNDIAQKKKTGVAPRTDNLQAQTNLRVP
jgi:hypothetical protein